MLEEIKNTVSFIQNKISIFPNPSNGKINIQSENTIDEIRIANFLGQIIVQSNPNTKSVSINFNYSGIYFVTILSENSIVTKQIVVTGK